MDESGSTEGENAAWGKALALTMLGINPRDGRKFALVHFASRNQFKTDLFLPGQYGQEAMLRAAECFLNGGTDFETPLIEALRLMEQGAFKRRMWFLSQTARVLCPNRFWRSSAWHFVQFGTALRKGLPHQ